jgi:hypothetical protein
MPKEGKHRNRKEETEEEKRTDREKQSKGKKGQTIQRGITNKIMLMKRETIYDEL